MDTRRPDGARDGPPLSNPSIASITVGSAHVCALRHDGRIACWGWNDWGMVGIGTTTPENRPVLLGLVGASEVVASVVHTCALLPTREVYCWGYGGYQQLGVQGQIQPKPQQFLGANAVQLALGHTHTCLLDGSGVTLCAGGNGHGQLGDGSYTSRGTLKAVALTGCEVRQLASGDNHVCARCASGEVRCWGSNALGQLGTGTHGGSKPNATAVTLGSAGPLADATAIWAGGSATCAARKTGAIDCWGDNHEGQLTGEELIHASPRPILRSSGGEVLTGIVEVSLASRHTCVRTADRRAWCWGNNLVGALGDGSTIGDHYPRQVPNLENVLQVRVGGSTSCALLSTALYCWGHNGRGQLGNGADGGELFRQKVVTKLGTTLKAKEIAAGERHTCAIRDDEVVVCWGNGTRGRLGSSLAMFIQPTPVEVVTATAQPLKAVQVDAGFAHSCALSGGALYCWGQNDSGQAGSGSAGDRTIAAAVTDPAAVNLAQLALGAYHTCVLDKYKVVHCMGRNGSGQLGLDPSVVQNSLTPVPTLGAADSIACGDHTSCAIVNTEAICWGSNQGNILGTGEIAFSRFTPAAVNLAPKIEAIAVGRSHACATQEQNGTRKLFCWGDGGKGQLGAGNLLSSKTPSPVVGLLGMGTLLDLDSSPGLDWTGAHTCAVTEGQLPRCWGWNAWGQLGIGTRADMAEPTTAKGLPTAKRIATGAHHSCLIDGNDEVYCWGYNGDGAVGVPPAYSPNPSRVDL